jgi:hypothetical protein
VRINKRTSKSTLQDGEVLNGPEELPGAAHSKPMMELEAGTNVWYQAWVLKESVNEVKVRFPRTCRNRVLGVLGVIFMFLCTRMRGPVRLLSACVMHMKASVEGLLLC